MCLKFIHYVNPLKIEVISYHNPSKDPNYLEFDFSKLEEVGVANYASYLYLLFKWHA